MKVIKDSVEAGVAPLNVTQGSSGIATTPVSNQRALNYLPATVAVCPVANAIVATLAHN